MEKAHLTLYTVIGSPQHILTGIQSLFAPVIQSVDTEADQIRVTLQDDSLLVFHLSHVREKAGFIEMHIEGMANYFAQAATSNPALKENVLRQIRCFNCVVGIVFETDDNNDRTRYLINTLFDLAHQVKGYLLYPNMHLYDGEGKLVFSREGESELTEFTPVAHADLLDGDRPEETSADRERRERSVALLQTQGIPYLETLKSEVPETEVHLKSREEMMQRAATLFAVAVYSEVMLSENPDRNEALTYFNKMDEIYGIQSWLTPAEAAYISNPDPTGQECIQFVWRYENCAVLLWAAGIVEELPYPSEICDVPVIAAIFWQHKSIGDLLGQGIGHGLPVDLDAHIVLQLVEHLIILIAAGQGGDAAHDVKFRLIRVGVDLPGVYIVHQAAGASGQACGQHEDRQRGGSSPFPNLFHGHFSFLSPSPRRP